MKSVEDAAREYEENQSSPSGMIGQDAKAFLAGHAHAVQELQSIWKKPSERPDYNRAVVGFDRDGSVLSDILIIDAELWPQNKTMVAWCYATDLFSFLPDFAKEEK